MDSQIDIDAALSQLQSSTADSQVVDDKSPTPNQDVEADGMGILSSESGGYLGRWN